MRSILVVEDDRDVAAILRVILEESYRVEVFEDPNDLPRGSSPALVITDLARREGYRSSDAVSDVRALRLRTAAPILVLTAHGAAGQDDELAREATAVMTKPFEMSELVELVERLAV